MAVCTENQMSPVSDGAPKEALVRHRVRSRLSRLLSRAKADLLLESAGFSVRFPCYERRIPCFPKTIPCLDRQGIEWKVPAAQGLLDAKHGLRAAKMQNSL